MTGEVKAPVVSDRAWRAAAAAAALVGVAVYLARFPSPLSNIDDYNLRPFAAGFLDALGSALRADLGNGRVRPLYWVLEGGLGAVTGSAGTVLHVGRSAFLALAIAFQVLVGRRLGAGPLASAALALAAAWSSAAIGTWSQGGPAEAFAQPLALACTWAAVSARGGRGFGIAAALGLAAAFVKESYCVWTGAVMLGAAVSAGARRPRGAWWWALAGAAVQIVPAVLALALVPSFRHSYAKSVLVDLAATPGAAALEFLDLNLLPAAVGAAGVIAIVWRRVRDRAAGWEAEDVIPVLAVVAVGAQTFLLGLLELRYQLPFATLLLVAAARGAARAPAPRARLIAIGGTLAMIAALAVMGGRAFFVARLNGARCRADARMRDLFASGLRASGELRVLWAPLDVEAPIGALEHLRADGIEGRVEMKPCAGYPSEAKDALERLFATYPGPTTDAAPIVASSDCGVGYAGFVERVCVLATDPGALLPTLQCEMLPERAAILR